MLKLIVDQESAADPVMPVRWCLSQSDLDHLARKTDKPYILLVVTDSMGKEETRSVVPLTAMMEYLRFQRPGKHRIQAVVVWPFEEEEDIENHFLNIHRGGGYRVRVIQANGLLQEGLGCGQAYKASLDVRIEERFFAKDPPKLEQRWVNLFFNTPAIDQCHFRKRRILAYTIQPLVIPPFALIFWVAKSIVTAVMATVAIVFHVPWEVKSILAEYWDNVRHPWNCDIADLKDEIKESRSFLLWKKDGEDWTERPFWINLFYPPLTCLVFLVSLGFGGMVRRAGGMVGLTVSPRWYFSVPIGLAAIFIIFLVVLLLNKRFKNRSEEHTNETWEKELARTRAREAKEDRERQEKIAVTKQELSVLACDRAGPAELDALPADKQTFHLRFQRTKAKVCRPYAR